MKNFTPHRDGFRFRAATEGDIVEISLGYNKGGVNHWNGKNEARGIYLFVTPRTLEKRENGITVESFTISGDKSISGAKMFVLALGRASKTRMQSVAETLDNYAPVYAAQFESMKANALPMILLSLRELFPLGSKVTA
jgi:hypothetical protein